MWERNVRPLQFGNLVQKQREQRPSFKLQNTFLSSRKWISTNPPELCGSYAQILFGEPASPCSLPHLRSRFTSARSS